MRVSIVHVPHARGSKAAESCWRHSPSCECLGWTLEQRNRVVICRDLESEEIRCDSRKKKHIVLWVSISYIYIIHVYIYIYILLASLMLKIHLKCICIYVHTYIYISIRRSFFMTETGCQSCIRWPSKGHQIPLRHR